ncbi:hypothetical protein Clacol_002012 [Clathrus columnatus]|uniref:Thioredoxin domain-containing protein n=1 Tax=Clathrus columnatus TaxID=1419009 RepID=A0AAV5A2G5_9AGAM|nr:hypothetical protein Clacol_002012 [Clathrus columnatus]
MFLSPLIVFSLIFTGTSLPVESAVVEHELTSATFSDSINDGVWFIEFFSPKCHHCRAFAPTWERLVAYTNTQQNPGISLAKVNCLAQGDLCKEQNIAGYPSLLIYEDGLKTREFTEEREYERLTMFINAHAKTPPPPPPAAPRYSPNPGGDVLSLDFKSFYSAINDGPIFVKFFAPWCGHCKKLAPIWNQFALEMKGRVTVAEVNCDEQKALCKMQGIKGYPTIFFYQHGRTTEFSGGRKLEALKSFADAALAPPLSSVSHLEFEEAVKKQPVVYAVVHDKLSDSIRDLVEEASQPLLGTPPIFSVQTSLDLLSSLGLPSSQPLPVLVCLKDHTTQSFSNIVLSSASTLNEVSNWLIRHSLPSSVELDADNFAKIMGSTSSSPKREPRLAVIAALHPQDVESIHKLQQIAKIWLQKHRTLDGQVVFTWMDRQKWDSWLKSTYGIKASSSPAVVLADHSQLVYYDDSPNGVSINLTYESISATIEAVHNGSLKAKHSENVIERFVRYLNNKARDLGTAVSEHPFRTVFFIGLIIVGIFYVIKRLVDNDFKRYGPTHHNDKGARSD